MKGILKYTLLLAGIATGATMVSCSDETPAQKDKGATPVVKYVRPADIEHSDSLITAASLGQKIVFVGENLGDVQQIWFNDKKSKLNPTMVTSHTIICDIPNSIPGEVTNIARIITGTGIEIEYPFQVVVPAPSIKDVNCEYAPAGSLMTINGAYFADDPNVPITVKIAGVDAPIKELTETRLVVEVPEGAQEGPVNVTSIYGSTDSKFHYMDTRGMLFDFDPDGITGLGTGQSWHARPVVEDEHSISGAYMVIGNADVPLSAGGDWNDSDYSFEYWAGAWTDPVSYPERVGERLYDVADFSDFNNKSIKFELMIPSSNPWQAGAMHVLFTPLSMVSFGAEGVDVFGNQVAGCTNVFFHTSADGGYDMARYLWVPWTDSQAYDTADQWITVTMPISDFKFNADGTGASRMLGDITDFANFDIFVWGGDAGGAAPTGVACSPLFYIDNIRVVAN
ncbi:MAG: IPT/TIG domain-containing protein [Muribaculaceae bacterium]|nr:IPT/TIG domain-containing protein [Muribaculaceae bacterium]